MQLQTLSGEVIRLVVAVIRSEISKPKKEHNSESHLQFQSQALLLQLIGLDKGETASADLQSEFERVVLVVGV